MPTRCTATPRPAQPNGLGTDELLESEQWSGPNPPTLYYPLADDQFSIVALWEVRSEGTRSVAQRLSYGDYGNQTVRNANGTIAAVGTAAALRHGYTGRLHDATSGLTEYRHRWMNPAAGTFLQRDPLGYVDGMNLYVYGYSRPTSAVDPYGLCASTTGLSDSACQTAVDSAFKYNKKIKQLMKRLLDKNCPIPVISCKQCTGSEGGSFDPRTKFITICANAANNGTAIIEILAHELVRAIDDCNGIDWKNCDERACSEIRAYNLSGNCRYGGWWRQPFETFRDCVRRLAARSTSIYPGCGDGTFSVNKVFSRCFKDTSPLSSAHGAAASSSVTPCIGGAVCGG